MFHDERFPSSGARVLLAFLGMLAITFGAFALSAQSRSGFSSFLCGGWIFSAFCLAAIWGVFAPGNWFTGWLPSAAGVILLGFCAAWTTDWSTGRVSLDDLPHWIATDGRPLLILPCLLFAMQIPLFLIRFWGGFRIVSSDDIPCRTCVRAGQFEIRDLIGLMTSLGVVLACYQMGFVSSASPEANARNPSGILLFTLFAGGIGTLVLVPWIYAMASVEKRVNVFVCAFAWNIVVPCCILFAIDKVFALMGVLSMNWEEYSLAFLSAVGVAATILSGLFILSACGYVFVRAAKRSPYAVGARSSPAAAAFVVEAMKRDAQASRAKRK